MYGAKSYYTAKSYTYMFLADNLTVKRSLIHCALFLDPILSDHHGQDQVLNCPIGQPFTKREAFCGSVCPWPQGQAEVGRDQDLPGMVQKSSNLGKLTIFDFQQ